MSREPGAGIGAVQKWLILATVTLATTLYSTTVLVVSVILPQMQGSMSATQDQIAWTVTFNLVATAVGTPGRSKEFSTRYSCRSRATCDGDGCASFAPLSTTERPSDRRCARCTSVNWW